MKQKLRVTSSRKAVATTTKNAESSKEVTRATAARKKTFESSKSSSIKSRSSKKLASNRETPSRKGASYDETIREFRTVVNLGAAQLERWLGTEQSKKLERLPENGETAAGVGRKVLSILSRRRNKYSVDDFKQMRTVIDHVNRRLSKRPKGDIVASNWRYSLMNWGHDPTKRMKRTNKL